MSDYNLVGLEEQGEGLYRIKDSLSGDEFATVRADETYARLESIEGDFSSADYELLLEETERALRSIFDTDNYYRLVEQVDNYARY